MAPTSRVILCRHSQAEHNVDLDYTIHDAPLTALGRKQSASLASQIPQLQAEVDVIISSALKRTLQTTKLGWAPAVARLGIKNVVCLPQAQECNDFPCDTGSSREQLESLDEFKDFNLELLTPDWTSKKGFYAPDPASITNRARWVRQYIRGRKEATIVLVAHGDVLRQITSTAAGPSTYVWKNAEVREFAFDPATAEADGECFLFQKENVAAAGGYEATSTEMDIADHKLVSDTQPQTTKAEDRAVDEESKRTHTGMLDPNVVAQDQTIFTPHGRIVFPRSDGDANYRPPNVVVPSPTDREVNYYHIFARDEAKWVSWSKGVALKLAVECFGLPPLAPNKREWALDDFPTDYYMTEQRKGLRKTYRTDPYLFGSAAHRFRSMNEFLPHAVWLLCDPGLDPKNCRCRYCPGTSRSGPSSDSVLATSVSKRVVKPPTRFQTASHSLYRARNKYKIRAQVSPRELPGVPLPVYSSKVRNEELAAVEASGVHQPEGFRVGEVVYCRLSQPIVGAQGECITDWPAIVEATRMHVEVDRSEGPSTDTSPAFDLRGRVAQQRQYDVIFVPTHERKRVAESRLMPALLFSMPDGLRGTKLGTRKDHPWLIDRTTPELNLENDQRQRPPFAQLAFCFLYGVESCALLRHLYTATDQFTRAQNGRPEVTNVVAIDGDGAAAGDTEGPNRFLQSSEKNNYADLDSDDRHNRRRLAVRSGTAVGPGTQALSALDSNIYWQGIQFGFERLWVGDLVRLRLGTEDVETMMTSLARGNDLYNAADRIKPDLSCAYVLRIKAMYRTGKAEVERTDDKIRVAGDVFRVVDLQDKSAAAEGPVPASSAPGEAEEALAKTRHTDNLDAALQGGSSAIGSSSNLPSPTWEVPFRPMLDRAYENGLPMTPTMGADFGFQRVNQSSVEVVCSVQQLAGRLWCSLAQPGDNQVAREERRKLCLAHEDSSNAIRVRLSLAGMLPGSAKAMEVHPTEGHFISRERAFGQASKLALETCVARLTKDAESGLNGVDEGQQTTSSAAVKEEPSDQGNAQHDASRAAKRVRIDDAPPSPWMSTSPPLPKDWVKRTSRSGQGTYYANIKTKETSWDLPTGP